MNLDDKLREMAQHDQVPLPDGYDEMLSGLYASLPQDGNTTPSRKPKSRLAKKSRLKLTRLLTVAAVIALMAASMAVGALAFGKETVVEVPVEVPVEVTVEVPAQQETITMEDLGLTLILPDSWKDNYVVEYNGSDSCTVYEKSNYEASEEELDGQVTHAGMLFFIQKWRDYPMTAQVAEDEANDISPADFLLATSDGTYILRYASDVQWLDGYEEAYTALEETCRDIQVVVDNAFAQAQQSSGGR